MPSCSKTKNKNGIEIVFTEENHEYHSIINNEKLIYISGTTFISKFFKKFDVDGSITRRCAFKQGITEEQQRQIWKEKADQSCRYGTKIHESMEDWLLNRPLRNTPDNDKEIKSMKNANILSNKILERGKIEGIEKIVFDPDLKIAGSIDLLLRSKKNNQLFICDYKTNEKILTENKYNNFGLYCLKHIPDTNFYHYELQLNIYEYLLKHGGYVDKHEKIGKCLFHITENGVKTIPIGDRQKEIKDMISFQQNNPTIFFN